jgi:hypothetical protein
MLSVRRGFQLTSKQHLTRQRLLYFRVTINLLLILIALWLKFTDYLQGPVSHHNVVSINISILWRRNQLVSHQGGP